ncbi:type IV pilus assembly protein PilM [bacterium]|nr:type IV pilus assembly protein PilM [bacterium]
MENPFGKILNLKKIGLGRKRSAIGIDIGSSSIKVVQLRKEEGKAILETYGELALGPYAGLPVGRATRLPVEKAISALNDLFKEAEITTRNSGIAIPLESALMTLIEMPRMDDKQLARVIPIEARKYIPVHISEVSLDWWIVPPRATRAAEEEAEEEKKAEGGMEMMEVLVAAIHNEALERFREIEKKMALEANFLEIEIFSALRSSFSHGIESVMTLDMGTRNTKLAMVESGIVRGSHIINKGSQDITQALAKGMDVDMSKAEELKREYGMDASPDANIRELMSSTANYIFSETNRVLLAYERKHNRTIDSVILMGGGVRMAGILEYAQNNLETEVVMANPFSKIETPAFLEDALKKAGPNFAVSVGLALRKIQD